MEVVIKLSFRPRRMKPDYNLVVLLILSGLLMVSDHYHRVTPLRQALNNILAPLQYLVDTPIRLGLSLRQSFVSRYTLLHENTHLRSQQLLLQVNMQRFLALENENRQLKQLLNAIKPLSDKSSMLLAKSLAVNTTPLVSELVLDRGQYDGVKVGQPVVNANGIMGQIIEVNLLTSRVLLITDPRSAVPVESIRNGLRGIIIGHGKQLKLLLTTLDHFVDIKPDDLFVTSGLGGRYPSGYPVGIVTAVHKALMTQALHIMLVPCARLNHNQPVVILLYPAVEPATAAFREASSAIQSGQSSLP